MCYIYLEWVRSDRPPGHLESSEAKEDFKFPSLEKESVFLII